MITLFENFLRSLSSEAITNTFFILMMIVFGICLLLRVINSQPSEFKNYAPTLLTSLGILGTFVGIVSGLLNFDIDNIDSSISQLLAGMKTAFSTSVIGVFLSILLKVIYTFFTKKNKKGSEKSVDIESVINNFYEQTEHLKQQSEQTQELNKSLDSMLKMLGSESDGSLLGQIKLLRSDLSDSHKISNKTLESINSSLNTINSEMLENKDQFSNFESKLWIKLQDFADMMSKSATEAVIDALKKVIQDFNNNLTEQFGDNFKQLNQAVIKLIDWQENYKNQLNEMITLYNTGVQSLTATEQSISIIERSTSSIPNSMDKLDSVIQVNQHQIENLERHLTTFADLRDKAVNALPEVQKQIEHMLNNVTKANDELTQGLKNGADELYQSVKTSGQTMANHIIDVAVTFSENTGKANIELSNNATLLEKTAEQISQQNKVLTEHQKQLFDQITQFAQRWNKEFDENTKRIQEQFSRAVEDMIKKQIDENVRLMKNLEKESENALKTTGESVKKQLDLIDKSMQEEVNRVMQQMGSALATITNKFTDDYARLTNAMAEIVRLQRGKF